MFKKLFFPFALIFAMAAALGCQHLRDRQNKPAPQSVSAAEAPLSEQGEHITVVVYFTPGGDIPRPQDLEQVRHIARGLGASGYFKTDIKIIAWSDKDFPLDRELPLEQRELAQYRIGQIQKELFDLLGADVGSNTVAINLAEPNELVARSLRSDDVELESVFAKHGASEPQASLTNEDLRVIRAEGGPTRALVILTSRPKATPEAQ